MFRAILELLITIVVVIAARAILTSFLKGLAAATQNAAAGPQGAQQQPQGPPSQGTTLHKDPNCGTFVPESTPYATRTSATTMYFCSAKCRDEYLKKR